MLDLKRENQTLRQQIAEHREHGPIDDNVSSSHDNTQLSSILDRMHETCMKFCRLEIEEETLQADVKRLYNSSKAFRVSSSASRQTTSAPSSSQRFRRHGKMTSTSPRRTTFLPALGRTKDFSSPNRKRSGVLVRCRRLVIDVALRALILSRSTRRHECRDHTTLLDDRQ